MALFERYKLLIRVIVIIVIIVIIAVAALVDLDALQRQEDDGQEEDD
eukprot:COSAG06_NODE_57383_length_280_cov_1.132597_1_plen_46_part_10